MVEIRVINPEDGIKKVSLYIANQIMIEGYLKVCKHGATINQISKFTKLSWLTVKRHIEKLKGKVVCKKIGKFNIYYKV